MSFFSPRPARMNYAPGGNAKNVRHRSAPGEISMEYIDEERTAYQEAGTRLVERIIQLGETYGMVITPGDVEIDDGTSEIVTGRHKVVIRTRRRELAPVYMEDSEFMAPVLDWEVEGRLAESVRELTDSCGRYTLYCGSADLADLTGVELSEHQLAVYRSSRGYNVTPSQTAPIMLFQHGHRAIVPARWGFHPAWAGEDAPIPINAHAETIFADPVFRSAITHRRCLVPTTGWYQWQAVSRTERRPLFIRPAKTEVFAFAGIFEPSDDEPGRTFAVIVGAATGALASLHPYQPVMVPPEDYDAWLNPRTGNDDLGRILTHRATDYDRRPVSRRVNNPRNDDPGVLEAE